MVAVRLRPFVPYEKGQKMALNISGNMISIADGVATDKKKRQFVFDYCMDSTDPGDPAYVGQDACYHKIASRMV
eukprot:CAMPEP_0197666150 /NCGR_PEP_ID=MMETSP1338-20131121/61675_1 /TAXON_ID=43686 ORGANISM="Pelagodinium beii, Strain RCC1491" /NCGR_SAMPLE_ID=MMETSP1338 /ASSEMBLY_ACC=CAM_ASM_000754 /LENGTH=73 /DNA_ID=CAMNT_0043245131 /DNA_START=12 /DNA_END=230 /DNA_ORIENTATION=-